MGTRRLLVGCEFSYDAAVPTPAIFQVRPLESDQIERRNEAWSSTPQMRLRSYADLYGNPCTRVVLPAGRSSFRYQAELVVPDGVEAAEPAAAELAPDDLPDEVLIYTVPSRYCLPDVLGNEAWSRFGNEAPGYQRVQAICDHVNNHLTFRYGSSTAWSTAADVNTSRLGVCRDFTHVRFELAALVERIDPGEPVRLGLAALSDPRLLRATPLTAPDDRLRELADRLGTGQPPPDELASKICAAVHSAVTYEFGVTSVRITAAEALAGGRGVCQDSAHIMLALCHLLGLPARYVSGHLLGQGGTHAWVEVVLRRDDHAVALPLDPCNGVPGSVRYLTVATGRDYADVRPTSGSYLGTASGRLSSSRRVAVLAAA